MLRLVDGRSERARNFSARPRTADQRTGAPSSAVVMMLIDAPTLRGIRAVRERQGGRLARKEALVLNRNSPLAGPSAWQHGNSVPRVLRAALPDHGSPLHRQGLSVRPCTPLDGVHLEAACRSVLTALEPARPAVPTQEWSSTRLRPGTSDGVGPFDVYAERRNASMICWSKVGPMFSRLPEASVATIATGP